MTDTNKMKFPKFSFVERWKEKRSQRKENARNKMQSDEMMNLAEKLKFHKNKVHLRTAILIVSAAVLVCGIFLYTRFRVFHSYKILSSVERSDDAATGYVRLGNRTLKCNPNGVTCVNDSNDVKWNVTFTMQSPIVDVCGPMMAVGDQRGQEVYIFNKDGQVGHFQVEHSLMKLRVASQGVVAAVLEDGEVTWVQVYDSKGSVIVKNKTSMNETGYPIDIDLSENGQKMAVSYLTMDNKNVKSKVAFYNFSSVGQSESDYMVSSAEYEGTVVPAVNFLSGNRAVVFRDDGLTFFSGKQVPEQKSEVKIEQEIISVFHNDDYVGIISASDEEEKEHKYKMQVFRANGAKCGTRYFDIDYTDILISDNEVLLYGMNNIEVYGTDGRKKAVVEYEKQILDMIKTGGFSAYQVITPDSTDRIKLK